MQADRGSRALLMSLRQAVQTNAFNLKHLQFLFCEQGNQYFVWVANRWHGLRTFERRGLTVKPRVVRDLLFGSGHEQRAVPTTL